MVAKLKGYPLTCVMPANATEERRRLLRIYGADIVESPAEEGSNGAVRLALELAERDPSLFMPFQYANEANPRAHYEGTGAEIAEALDRIDVLVAGLGTGGTLMGAGERVRETFPEVSSPRRAAAGRPVMGLRSLEDGYVPPILDVSKLDRKLLVSNEESLAGVRALLDRGGDLRGRLLRRGRPRRAPARRGARRGRRRLHPRRRRLEVPLRRLLGRADPARRWSTATGGSPRRAALELERHADEEAPNEACGLLALRDGVAERYIPCVNTRRQPVPLRSARPRPALIFELEDEGWSSPSSTRTRRARPSRRGPTSPTSVSGRRGRT
jgi:hypothetical protein